MKDWFKHDYNARNDERLLEIRAEFGAEGYGAYWMLLESMAESSEGKLNRGAIGGLCLAYGIPKERLLGIIDYCIKIGLFVLENEGLFYSERMIEHKEERANYKQKGIEGAQKRWKNRGAIGVANGLPNAEETRGEEKREDNNKQTGGNGPRDPEAAKRSFVPPSESEVQAYFEKKAGFPCIHLSRQFTVRFFAYYLESDWHDKAGKKVVDWQQTIDLNWLSQEHWTNLIEKARPKKRTAVI